MGEAAVAMALVSAYQGEQDRRTAERAHKANIKRQEEAQAKADLLAEEEAKRQEQLLNSANQEKPDTSVMAEKRRAKAKKSSTLLTGRGGAGLTAQSTSSSSLLGG